MKVVQGKEINHARTVHDEKLPVLTQKFPEKSDTPEINRFQKIALDRLRENC